MATYSASISPDILPGASLYQSLRADASTLREPHAPPRFAYSERHLQCAWWDERFRPQQLATRQGEPLVIEHPGVWNLEAGPDFLGAVVLAGPEQRRIKGDVEIHIVPADWKNHGHHDDPNYRNVRFHVTWQNTPVAPDLFPPGTLQIPLSDILLANPRFSFEHIDLAAYPYAARDEHTPCRDAIRNCAFDQQQAVLSSAGMERLRRKAARMREALETVGPEQALYEEVMAALGYKHNKIAMRTLARILPIEDLRRETQNQPETAYALLLGLAGLLPARPSPRWEASSQYYVRDVWHTWWRLQESWSTQRLQKAEWTLSGLRPANRPERRLMAAVQLFLPESQLLPLCQQAGTNPAAFIPAIRNLLQTVSHPYWDLHFSLNGKTAKDTVALIGTARASAMITNVLLPFTVALHNRDVFDETMLADLPAENINAIIRQTAATLLGPDHPPRLYAKALERQGLIQIFQDFCLNDRSRCRNCPLPHALRQFSTGK
jgi:hypothetical protein